MARRGGICEHFDSTMFTFYLEKKSNRFCGLQEQFTWIQKKERGARRGGDFTMLKAYTVYLLESQGFPRADIAKLLGISERTVRWYLKRNGLPRKVGRPKADEKL